MLKSLFPWKHHKTKAMAAQQTMDVVPEDPPLDQPLLPCHVCGRTFLLAPLKKHERVCEKSASKKRKPFDSLRQRVEGTDLADFHQKTYLKRPEPTTPAPEPKRDRGSHWKEKHLELVNTIRAAKGVPTATVSTTKPKSTTSLMAGNERCPSCDRQFGPKAFDRHVEWCKEKKAQQRIHQSPATVLLAKERLEARTKYVPPLNKSKKTVVREKYSNQNTSTETLASKSLSPLSRGPSVRKPRSEVTLGRGSDKGSEKVSEKVEKSGVSHGGDKLRRQESMTERHTPVIASKGDLGKSSQKKIAVPYMKVNDTNVNLIDGISVSSLKFDYNNKKMVTWKDTVGNSSEELTDVENAKHNPKNLGGSSKSMNSALPEADKVNCDKILSCSDILHKDSTKISSTRTSLAKKINANKSKGKTISGEGNIELEAASDEHEIVLKPKLTNISKRINLKKPNRIPVSKQLDKCEEDSIEMNKKAVLPPISLKTKLKYPLPLTKKTFGKKIVNTRKKFLNDRDIIENQKSDTLEPKECDSKSTITEEDTNSETAHRKEKPGHFLKSSFTKKINNEKFRKTVDKSVHSDTVLKESDQDASNSSSITDKNPNSNMSILYRNNHALKTVNKFEDETVSDRTIQSKITLKFSESEDGRNTSVASKCSENSVSSNCSTVNTEETYLINRNSTDEFNSSQSGYTNPDSSTSLSYSTSNVTEIACNSTGNEYVRNFIYEKNGGKIVSIESGGKSLSAVIDSQDSMTVNLSDESINVENCSKSCQSVTVALEKLTIDSNEVVNNSNDQEKAPVQENSKLNDGNVEKGEIDQHVVENEPLSKPTTMFDSFRNTHKEFTNWFDEFMKKNEGDNDEENVDGEVEQQPEEEPQRNEEKTCVKSEEDEEKTKTKSENLVVLFKSTTNLDLTCADNDKTVETGEFNLKDRISEETLGTSCELDSFDLDLNKPSNFSLKKSLSEIDITTTSSSYLGLSGKNTLISIYYNKNKECSDLESLSEPRRTRTKSLPNIYLVGCTVICQNGVIDKEEKESSVERSEDSAEHRKEEPVAREDRNVINRNDVLDERENLRRKILELAAEEFIEEYRGLDNTKEKQDESVCDYPEEDYTVPKKKRKIENTAKSQKENGRNVQFSDINFDLHRFKAMTIGSDQNAMGDYLKKTAEASGSSNGKSPQEKDISSSARTTVSTECSPRLVTLLDKVLNVDKDKENKSLIVVTLGDCLKLVQLDGRKLPKIKKKLERIKEEHCGKKEEVRLPFIGSRRREDKEIQAGVDEEESMYLPKITDKFIRRGVIKRCTDVRAGVRDVYLEYDGDSNIIYDPFESAQRQFLELLDCDDFKSLNNTSTPVKNNTRPHTTNSIKHPKSPSPTAKPKIKSAEPALSKINKNINRASVIDPPFCFKDSLDSITDDFELMETLVKDNFADDIKNQNGSFYLHLKPEKESLTLSDILDNRKYSDDLSIDPRLINENDNLSIPEHFKIDDFSPTSTTDTDITIQNDIDHYSLQYDNKISAFDPKPVKKPVEKKPVVKRSTSLVGRGKTAEGSPKPTSKKLTCKSKLRSRSVSSVTSSKATEKKKGLSSLKKATALFDPTPKPPSLKNKNEVDNYFLEKQQKNLERNSPEKEVSETSKEVLKPDDLFAVDDEMYEEYKKYEEMYLKEKSQSTTKKKQKPKLIDINFGILTASEEEEVLANNKISNDSAYGSLTRKTPKQRTRATKLTPLEQKQPDSTSSSGSEHCPTSPAAAHQRFSKFCHECGNKYPVSSAKFCVECGVKRLVL